MSDEQGGPGRVVGNPVLDAVLDYGQHTAEAAKAAERGERSKAVAASHEALLAFARLVDLAKDRPGEGSGGEPPGDSNGD